MVASSGACIPLRLHSATSQHRNTLSICANCCVSLPALTWPLSGPRSVSCLYLQQQWLQASIRFWNRVVVLPVGDLYRDLMFDSLQEAVTHGPLNKGFVKGLTEQCAQIGFSLADLGLLPVNLKMIMNLSQLQQRAGMDDVDTCPRTCPSAGAMVCTYRRWFYVSQGRAGRLSSGCRLMRARSHSLCASAWAATGYPVTWDAIGRILSHAMNVCAPGVRTGGGTRITWFSIVLHFSISETSIPLFCWAPHDAILYESGRSEEYYSLYL